MQTKWKKVDCASNHFERLFRAYLLYEAGTFLQIENPLDTLTLKFLLCYLFDRGKFRQIEDCAEWCVLFYLKSDSTSRSEITYNWMAAGAAIKETIAFIASCTVTSGRAGVNVFEEKDGFSFHGCFCCKNVTQRMTTWRCFNPTGLYFLRRRQNHHGLKTRS